MQRGRRGCLWQDGLGELGEVQGRRNAAVYGNTSLAALAFGPPVSDKLPPG